MDKTLLVTSAKDAIYAVDSLINWGADVIDLRTIHTKPILYAIIKRAHQKGKKVLARFSGNWIEASENGVDAFTHLSDLWRTTSKGREKYFKFSKADSMQFITTAEFYNRVLPSLGGVDTPYFYSLVKAFKKQNSWIITNTPSFFPCKKKFEHGDTSRNQYRTSRQQQLMLEDLKLSNEITMEEVKAPKPAISFIIMAAKAGVKLISGTQLERFITPGMSLHDMLYWLAHGGLTPAEALRTATINPAIFLNKQKELGTVEVGKLADLVLLDANPLTDINNTRKINAVVANGRLLQRKDLDKLLEDAKEKVKSSN